MIIETKAVMPRGVPPIGCHYRKGQSSSAERRIPMPSHDITVIEGHLAADAEMKEVSAGHVTSFKVLVNYGKSDDRKIQGYFVDTWHDVARGCQHLRKGEAVIVRGVMRSREHDGKWYWTLQAYTVGRCLYAKEEPVDTGDHSHEEVDDSSIPF
jgi:hypothetical protein